jgi:hypothetical protein
MSVLRTLRKGPALKKIVALESSGGIAEAARSRLRILKLTTRREAARQSSEYSTIITDACRLRT